jgi:hypothetical protein
MGDRQTHLGGELGDVEDGGQIVSQSVSHSVSLSVSQSAVKHTWEVNWAMLRMADR